MDQRNSFQGKFSQLFAESKLFLLNPGNMLLPPFIGLSSVSLHFSQPCMHLERSTCCFGSCSSVLAAAAAAPAAGPLSPRSGPPSRRAGGRPAQGPRRRRRRRSLGLLGGGDAAAPTDSGPLGSARLGRARGCSAPLGPARHGWGRGPRPPARVVSGARGGGALVRARAP